MFLGCLPAFSTTLTYKLLSCFEIIVDVVGFLVAGHMIFDDFNSIPWLLKSIPERQNHAHEMIQTMDLSAVDGIVIGSGDGLLYEVANRHVLA